MNYIELAQDGARLWDFVLAIMNLRVPFLNS